MQFPAQDEEGSAVYNELCGMALLPQVGDAWIAGLAAESGAGAKKTGNQETACWLTATSQDRDHCNLPALHNTAFRTSSR